MAEDLALNVEELRHLETKIPEIETEELLLKPEPKGNFSNDIEQDEDEDTLSKASLAGDVLQDICRNDIKQEIEISSIRHSEDTDGIEIKPSVVTETPPNYGEYKNLTELLSEGGRSLLNSSPLREIMTPMLNTVLHIAAWNGKDDDLDLVVERAPNLLFSFNRNKDSALHVAARAGHIPTVEKLLAAYTNFERPEIAEAWEKYKRSLHLCGRIGMWDLSGLVKKQNDQGNTMLHEAMICGKSVGAMIFKAFEPYKIGNSESLLESCKEYALIITNNAKQSVLYLAVEAADKEAVELILDNWCHDIQKPEGLSPVVASIMKRDKEMLSIILRMMPDWIHLTDKHGRLPLHYAASTSYFEATYMDCVEICWCKAKF